MTDELIEIPAGELVAFDEKTFDMLATGSSFLPRLSLCGSNSDVCKEGKIAIGNYAIIRGKDQLVDLGNEVQILVVSWRPKALEIGENIITVHEVANPEFKRIAEKSKLPNSGCQYGPEFLVWHPEEGFALFFCGSKSARNEAANFKPLIGKSALLRQKLASNKKFKWNVPVVTPCSIPMDNLPSDDEVKEQLVTFNNPPKIETIDSSKDSGRDR